MKKLIIALFMLFFSLSSAKTLKVAYQSDPVSLDPHEQISQSILRYSELVFNPLLRFDNDLKFTPMLAVKYERINPKTVRFYLRKGVKFHSGNDFSAKDVVWTLKRLKRSMDFKAIFEPIKEAKKVDKYTVDIISYKPFPLLVNTVTYLYPMDSKFYTGTDNNGNPKDTIIKNQNTYASRHESGTGKYYVAQRQQGIKLVYKEFKDYWNKDNDGNVDTIILTPIKNNASRVAALLSGDVDFITPIPTQDHERIRKNPKVKLVQETGTRILIFQMDQKRVPAFKDKRVRQAIIYAINNVAITKKIMKGEAVPAGQLSPKGFVAHDESLKPRYNLQKAKALMKEAGYEKGFTISMMAPNNRYLNDAKIAETVAKMLSRINIKVNLQTFPKAQYWGLYDKRSADMMMVGWRSDTMDSSNFTEFLAMCPNKESGFGQYNASNYCNKKVDALIRDSFKEINSVKRTENLKKVERILYEDAAFVPLFWDKLSWAAKKNVQIEKAVNILELPWLDLLVID